MFTIQAVSRAQYIKGTSLKEDGNAAWILVRGLKKSNSPIFFIGRGTTTGSRMFFLTISDYTIASTDATFGFPNALSQDPGIASQLLAG